MKHVMYYCVAVVLITLVHAYGADIKIQENIGYVTICFDDAHSSVFTHALPIFQQHGIRATAYVPTIGIDDKPFWHMSWKQIVALQDAGWEIGSHSHTHTSMLQLSPEKIIEELQISQRILTEHGIKATTFATPLGDASDEIIQSIKKYYIAHRGTEKVRGSQIELSLNDLDVDSYNIASIQVWYDHSLLKIENVIDLAVKEKKWAVFYFHAITEGPVENKDYKIDAYKLGQLVAYINDLQAKGMLRIVTIAEFVNMKK